MAKKRGRKIRQIRALDRLMEKWKFIRDVPERAVDEMEVLAQRTGLQLDSSLSFVVAGEEDGNV